jgi:hypothetical protein
MVVLLCHGQTFQTNLYNSFIFLFLNKRQRSLLFVGTSKVVTNLDMGHSFVTFIALSFLLSLSLIFGNNF